MTSEMLRLELLHPLIIHFPIALLFNAGLVRVFILIFQTHKWTGYLKSVYFWCLTAGTIGLFASYLSGEEAEHIVKRLICKPTVIEDHADFAKLALLFSVLTLAFSTAVAFMERRQFKSDEHDTKRASRMSGFVQACLGIEVFVLTATLGSVGYTSHLGASLVYQQGAGYHRTPDPNCKDSVESIDIRPEPAVPFIPNNNRPK